MTEAKIIELGPHENMSAEDCLAVCSREEWSDVLVLGFQPDSGAIVRRSSHMTREFALWIIEHAKRDVMVTDEDE